MHSFLIAGVFVMMVLSPCLVAIHSGAHIDDDHEYD